MELLKNVKKSIVDNTILKSWNEVDSFNIHDAWIFLAEQAKLNNEINYCVLDVTQEGNHYVIRIVAFDENGQPFYHGDNSVVGKLIKAYNLNRNVREFLQGNKKCRLYVKQLLVNTNSNDITACDE